MSLAIELLSSSKTGLQQIRRSAEVIVIAWDGMAWVASGWCQKEEAVMKPQQASESKRKAERPAAAALSRVETQLPRLGAVRCTAAAAGPRAALAGAPSITPGRCPKEEAGKRGQNCFLRVICGHQ